MFKTAFATALIAAAANADNVHDDAKIAGIVEGFFVGAFDWKSRLLRYLVFPLKTSIEANRKLNT